MSAAPKVIESYEKLLEHSRRMVECARQGDWPGLLEEKSRSLVSVENLSRCEISSFLDEAGRLRRFELLEEILELDAEIRHRLEVRREELGALIGSANRHKSRNAAYRTMGAAGGRATIYNISDRFEKGLA